MIFTSLFDFPIEPIWSFIGMVVGIIAFWVALIITGKSGSTSDKRKVIHWIVRVVVFVGWWAWVCKTINVSRFIAAHWILFVVGRILISTLIIDGVILTKLHKKATVKHEKPEEKTNE